MIDAVLGTGRSRPIEGRLGSILHAVGDSAAKRYGPRVISVDLPSGLDPDTGESDPATLDADVTVALGYPKLGLYQPRRTANVAAWSRSSTSASPQGWTTTSPSV